MPPLVALIVYTIFILGLFWLDRDEKRQVSKGLWVPIIWFSVCGSRPLSDWMPPIGLEVLAGPAPPARYIEGSPIDRMASTILIVLGLIVLIRRRPPLGRIARANVPIILLYLYCAFSIVWSDYPFVTLKHSIRGLGDVVMVLIVLMEFKPDVALKRLLSRSAFLLIPLSVLLIKYYPEYGVSYKRWTGTRVYAGITEGKNGLGMICLIFGLSFLWSFLTAYREPKGGEQRRRLIAYAAVLVMIFWLFSICNSMTSLSCFILAGGLMAVTSLSRFARKPAVLHLLVAAVITVPLVALFFDPGGGMVESLGRDPTLTGRTEIWRVVFAFVRNPLLGTGYESFWLGDRLLRIQDLTMPGLQEAHNGYIELYLNLGWIGVTLLALIIVTGYRHVLRALRRDPSRGGLGFAFFVATVVYSLSEAGFRMMTPVWIAFLLATTTLPEAAIPEGSPALGIECDDSFAAPQPQLEHVPGIGFPKEAI